MYLEGRGTASLFISLNFYLREECRMSEQDVVRLEEQVKTLFSTCARLEDCIVAINNKLSSWIPPWTAGLIAILTAMVGYFAKN